MFLVSKICSTFLETKAISKMDSSTQSKMMDNNMRHLAEAFQDVAQSNNLPPKISPLFIHNVIIEPAVSVALNTNQVSLLKL